MKMQGVYEFKASMNLQSVNNCGKEYEQKIEEESQACKILQTCLQSRHDIKSTNHQINKSTNK